MYYKFFKSGNKQLDFDTLNRLAEHFKVSTDYLLGRTDIRDPYDIKRINSCHDEDEWTDEELEDIKKFKEYVRMRRGQKKND